MFCQHFAIQQVINSPQGIARRDAIRNYKDSMYLAWQFNVTPQAEAWHQKISTENLNPRIAASEFTSMSASVVE